MNFESVNEPNRPIEDEVNAATESAAESEPAPAQERTTAEQQVHANEAVEFAAEPAADSSEGNLAETSQAEIAPEAEAETTEAEAESELPTPAPVPAASTEPALARPSEPAPSTAGRANEANEAEVEIPTLGEPPAPALKVPAIEAQPAVDEAPPPVEVPEATAESVPEMTAEAPAPTETTSESESELEAETPASDAGDVQGAPATEAVQVAEVEDEEVVIQPPKKRSKAAKTDKPKTPRKSPKRAAVNLPDPGDGSGYEAPETPDSGDTAEEAHWYAVHCYSGYENKVKHNLEQRIETMGMAGKILEIVVPTEDEIEVRDGKRRTVERRVFPGYVMVHMKMSEESWHVVRNTPGVTRFVGMGNRPQPLSQQEVHQILNRMEAEAPKIRVSFRTGQRVRITDGPFADFVGLVDKIDTERAKVIVLVQFFGRETPVELDFLQVERM